MLTVSLLQHFQLACTLGCGSHHAVIGADAGDGATVGVVVKAAVGIPKLDPRSLGLSMQVEKCLLGPASPAPATWGAQAMVSAARRSACNVLGFMG